MSDQQTQLQAPEPSVEPVTLDSVVAQAAELIVAWAERQGFRAWPLYFACGRGPCGAGHDYPMVHGPMRYAFGDALRDASTYGGAVAFVIRYAHPEVGGSMDGYERAMQERSVGALPGSLSIAPELPEVVH